MNQTTSKAFLLCVLVATSIVSIVQSTSNVLEHRVHRETLERRGGNSDDRREPPQEEEDWLNDFISTLEEETSETDLSVNEVRRYIDTMDKSKGFNFNSNQRIVGGNQTVIGDYPYYVEMGGCGGTLIAPDIVLFAAHCRNWSNKQINIGSFKRYNTNGGSQARFCAKWVADPLYNVGGQLNNDFALCKLDHPVEIDDSKIKLVLNLDASVPAEKDELQVAGLGRLTHNGASPWYLMHVTVPYVTTQRCNDPTSYNGKITDAMLCAGLPEEGGKDSCQGDSGGPLVKKIVHDDDTETHVHVGVVSWGYSCAAPNYPGVYARTSARADWIQEAMCDLGSVADFCNTPEPTCDGVLMNVTLSTDAYGRETAWTLTDKASNDAVAYRKYYVNYFDSWTSECIPTDRCYSMLITDEYGDGMCTSKGCGNYRVTIDGEEMVTGDGKFKKNITETFCVGTPPDPTEAPTRAPTPSPSSAPTRLECGGNPNLHYTIQVQTDSFGGDTSIYTYKMDEKNDNPVSIYTKDDFASKTLHTLPLDEEDSLCLEPDTCYVFAIGDSWGDGLTYGEDGWFKGFLGGQEVFSGDAEFGDYAEKIFCTEKSAPDSPTDVPSQTPTATPSASPTGTPSQEPTTAEPSIAPTDAPTGSPSASPTDAPSIAPTDAPTATPTAAPTNPPTKAPTKAPTAAPSASPTNAPTTAPSHAPSTAPSTSSNPTGAPTTAAPTAASAAPTGAPSVSPTTGSPTSAPTDQQVCLLQDDQEWRFKNRKRLKCSIYIRGKKQANLVKKCNKTWNGQKVHEACPESCGKRAGVGACEFLRDQIKKSRQKAREEAKANGQQIGESARMWQNIFVKEDLAVEEKKNFLRR